MVRKEMLAVLIFLALTDLGERVEAEALSIYEIQYSTDANGDSPENGNIVDCKGGIVVHKSSGSRTKLTLYDPNYPDGWGGVMAKDLDGVGAFAAINVGDWVSFTNVEVEDYKGTTFLEYTGGNNSGFNVVSIDNPLPRPLGVGVDEIAAPVAGVDSWLVSDHRAEKYEGMLIKVIDVTVIDTAYGKAYDNYILESNVNSNHSCWASDYLNDDRSGIYHPYVAIGERFCGVAGVLEQYAAEKEGIDYDYYQLLTTKTEDFTILQVADFDGDCDVDFYDFGEFALSWLETGCGEPDWCGGADLFRDGNAIVDEFDLMEFSTNWLEGKY